MKRIPQLREKLLLLLIFAAVILTARLLKLPCIYMYFLHIPCPGCGMTRAVFSALWLDFAAAFSYHWMFWSIPILLMYFFLDGKVFPNKLLNRGILLLIGAGFLANWGYSLLSR